MKKLAIGLVGVVIVVTAGTAFYIFFFNKHITKDTSSHNQVSREMQSIKNLTLLKDWSLAYDVSTKQVIVNGGIMSKEDKTLKVLLGVYVFDKDSNQPQLTFTQSVLVPEAKGAVRFQLLQSYPSELKNIKVDLKIVSAYSVDDE